MREEVIEILAMICPAFDFEDEDMNLADAMDSMEIVSLIEELENKFDIEITADDKTEDNFENIDTVVEMIERLQ